MLTLTSYVTFWLVHVDPHTICDFQRRSVIPTRVRTAVHVTCWGTATVASAHEAPLATSANDVSLDTCYVVIVNCSSKKPSYVYVCVAFYKVRYVANIYSFSLRHCTCSAISQRGSPWRYLLCTFICSILWPIEMFRSNISHISY